MSISDISTYSSSEDSLGELPKSWEASRSNDWSMSAKVIILKAASYLTDPICKVREYYYSFYILDETSGSTAQKVMKVASLVLGIVAFSLLTPLTAPIGAALRGMVSNLESKPYIYWENGQRGKVLPADKKITLVSHNQCYMPGGYSITDGQVTPPSDKERMDRNIRMLKELNPDIICLYEVPDICDASYLSSQLSEYPFMIPVAGIRAIGPSSGIYIASKYEIVEGSIEFVPFVKGTELTGRAQFAEKGFLSFDLKGQGGSAPTTVISTHLQHSEIPAVPIDHEERSRAMQMLKIARQIQKKVEAGHNVIFTGDLNQEEEELNAFLERHEINWLRRDASVEGTPTWGGDQWCADLTGKAASGSLVLDYTLIAGKATAISTKIIGTGYSGSEFRRTATSDHDLLFSTITVG